MMPNASAVSSDRRRPSHGEGGRELVLRRKAVRRWRPRQQPVRAQNRNSGRPRFVALEDAPSPSRRR